MAVRLRFPRFGWTTPVSAAAILAAALALPACGGSSNNSGGHSAGGSNGGSAAGGSNAGGSTTGSCPSACSGDKPVCDPGSGTCVGCVGDSDCMSPQVCDTTSHTCVACTSDAQCMPGTVCGPSGQCVDGCSDSQPCAGGKACCNKVCTDLSGNVDACGACDKPCDKPAHAAVSCEGGMCKMGMCDDGFNDCNKSADDGCETQGPCACTPGATQDCYDGPPGTKGVGTCKGGTSTCDASGTAWGPCDGEVIPLFDTCADGLDNDCNGKIDDPKDLDGDGWGPCDGDCCEAVGMCGNPNLVNPGAFEVPGNMVDDDCDGMVDNPLSGCDANLASNSADAMDYAKAIDLCQKTVENPAALKDKKWGVISGTFSLADGSGSPSASSRSIRQGFGSGVNPLNGARIALLSTGVAAAKTAPNNTSPNFAPFQGGQSLGTQSGMPADWLAANANNLPNAPGCPDPQGGTTAHDPIMLKLRIRVPTNAKSFAVSTNFYSSEYPEWVCSPFNDFFVTLLDSQFKPGAGQVANPADKNLAFYKTGNNVYPVGVNLAFGGTGLFTQCQTSSTGCGSGSVAGNNTCMSTAQLIGTGFDEQDPSQFGADPAYCSNSAKYAGGGTGWLTTNGNVKPGETIEIRFATWDTGDGWYDSLVLLDNFVWSLDASTPGTHQ
jgi:hypothetical protein